MTQDPRLGSYSNWLRANQDKRDTPEWQKVANAYKSLRATNAAPQAVAPAPQTPQQPPVGNPDASVFGYARDNMQKLLYQGVEAGGKLFGSEAVEDFGTRGVERNQQQLEDANYQSDYQGSFLDQEGITNKAGWTWEKILENSGTAAVGLGGAAATAVAAAFSAPLWVTLGIAGTAIGTSTVLGTGEVAGNIKEKTGTYDPKVAASAGLIIGLLDRIGATTLIPKDQLLKMGSNEIVELLAERGATGLATEFTKAVAKKSTVEGITEVAQDGTSMGAEVFSGAEVTGPEALNRAVDSFVLGAGTGATVTSALDSATMAGSLFNNDGSLADAKNFNKQQKGAIGDVARQLKQIATAEGFNLKNTDVSSQMGAKGALEALREANNGEITELAKALKPLLNSKDAKSLDQMLNDFAPANAAIKSGKNKVSGYVTKSQMKALGRLVAPYQEGQALMNALAKSNTITGLFKDGMKGGVSQFTDYFSPFGSSGAVYDPTRMGNIIIGGGIAGVTMGQSVPIQGGIVALGRLVDAATGRRNKLARFVNKNVNAQGLPSPSGVSLVDKAKTAAADAKVRKEALARIATQIDAPPNANSPVGTILSGTGLSRDGLSQTITRMSQDFAGQPELAPVLESIQQNMDGDTNPVLELNEIIPIIGQYAQMTSPELIVATPDNPLLARGVQQPPAQTQAQTAAPGQPQGQPQSGNQFTTPENYQAGKSDNNAFVRNLESKLADDTTLAPLDKAQLATALADMQASLGPNPVEAMTEMVEDLGNMGVSQEAIDTYVKPYADRVIAQQARVGRMQAPSDQAPAAPTVDQAPAAPTVDQSPVAPTVDQSPVAPTEEPQTYEAALERITPTNRVAAALERLTTTNRVAGAVDKITEGNMDPASVEAMLNQLEQDNPGIKARILEITGPQQQAAPEASSSTYKYAADTQDGKIERILYPEKSNKVPSNKPALTSQKSPLENIVSKFKRIKRTEKDNMIAYRGSDADTESYKFLDDVLGFLSNERRGSRSVDVNENIDIFESIFRPTIDALNANKPIPEAVEQKFQNLFGGPRQQSEDRPRFAKDLNSASQEPTLQTYVNPLNVPESEINATRLNESPSEADIQKMREGSYKPTKKRNLVKAADYMHQKWKEATGRSEPFEYTPENVDIISTYMATEAANALQSDANAIGWYDRKLKAAKRVVSLVDPRVTQSPDAEAAFDFALAVTSNGQAVADNFQYALEVFRHFMDNGKMPTDTWIKGGERNAAMLEAFDFFNAYQSSGANMPIQDFMDQDFTVKELNNYISRFNAQYGTEIKVPSSEGANSQVKGSYIIGPKIGQGFYQNIRGNYDPLTMDIWWMRMWNRLVGRPFVADPDLDQGRSNVKGALKTVGKLEQKMVNQTLKEMGVGKRDINKDPALFDDFVTKVEKRYQKFYKQYKEENGVNHTKPNFFKKTGTHVKNLKPQLQAQPKGPSERAYMRDVTKAAIAKLSDLGYNIETADFQALMWYPEKQLFRHLGVAPGRGSDNDYLDAAIMLAEGEGIANDQIQEALPDADGDGAVNNQPSTPRGDEGLYRGDGSDGPSQEGPRFNQQPTGVAGILAQRIQGSPDGPTARGAIPDVQEVKGHANHARALVEIGKPGSDYENGIKDQRMVEHLAKAVGVTLKMFNDHNAMLDDGGFTGENRKRGEDAGGVYMRKQNIARSLAPGAKVIRSGQVVRPFRSYLTALHEVAHGIAGRDIDGNLTQNVNMGKNYLTGNQDAAPIDTLEHMIGSLATMPSAKKNKIIKEIMSLQDNESFVGDGVYYGVRPTGPAKQRLETMLSGSSAKKQLSKDITNFEKYSRSIPELTVDPLIVYLENPKKMKSVAPETAKAIRAFFVNSSKIRFYSHPLAMAFAVVMAMLMKQEQAEEEERQQQQMPPGALNQPMPQGMLSA